MKDNKFNIGDVVKCKEDESIVFQIDFIPEKGLYFSNMKDENDLHFEFYESELELVINKFHLEHIEKFISDFKLLKTDDEKLSFLKENKYKVDYVISIDNDVVSININNEEIYQILDYKNIEGNLYFYTYGEELLLNMFSFCHMNSEMV